MLFSSYLIGIIGIISLVQAMRIDTQPLGRRALRQATRSEVVTRATRPQRRQAVSVLPYPQCPDYVATGDVPYARWAGLDYDSPVGALFTPNVQTREGCIKLCEVDRSKFYSLNHLSLDA